jgi:hypothetical protein
MSTDPIEIALARDIDKPGASAACLKSEKEREKGAEVR